MNYTECSVVWLSHLFWVQKTVGSNPAIPNNLLKSYANMSLKIYNNVYKLNFFYKDALIDFKSKANCFSLFNNRIVEGNIYRLKNFSFIDICFKYLTPTEQSLTTNTINLKVVKLESILNNMHFDSNKFKSDLCFKSNWSLLKEAFTNKCFVRGRVLNPIYNGFSVGIWGFVGFAPKKYSIINKCDARSVFIIMSIDYLKNTFVLSQNKIDKTSPRILFRMSSQLSYISKN